MDRLISLKIFRLMVRLVQLFLILFRYTSSSIYTGPFKGYKVEGNAIGSVKLPKLLGTYELEISDKIYEIFTDKSMLKFFDVGCAGGYYLSLASQINPGLSIIGYDTNKSAVDYVTRNLPGVTVHNKEFHFNKISKISDTFILIDIEGSEESLLQEIDPQKLQNVHIIVELHEDKVKPSFIETLKLNPNVNSFIPYNPRHNLRAKNWFGTAELRSLKTSYIVLSY
jgi:hypothetical protein